MTAAAPPAVPKTSEDLSARIVDLTSALRQARRRHRAQQDRALVIAMVRAVGGLAFSASMLWRHGLVDAEMREALATAGLTTPARLGKRLARLTDCDVAGFVVRKLGRDNAGAVWSIVPR